MILHILLAWLALSLPTGILIGKAIAFGMGDIPARDGRGE